MTGSCKDGSEFPCSIKCGEFLSSSGVTVNFSGRILLPEVGYEEMNTEEEYVACSLYDICFIFGVRVYK